MSKILLAYFSRAGENHGEEGMVHLQVGNTKSLAELIAGHLDCDVFEIVPADPYPEDYDATANRNLREGHSDARPEIEGRLPDLDGYQVVVIGSPVWDGRAPMIMRTFVERSGHLAGKTVFPFATYGGGSGTVLSDYQQWCPEADVRDGLAVQGTRVSQSANDVAHWADQVRRTL